MNINLKKASRSHRWFAMTAMAALVIGIGLSACSKATTSAPTVSSTVHTLYHCPMHPQYISDKPGNCPICDMRLVPVDHGDSSTPVPGQARVTLTPATQQAIGVKTAMVEEIPLDMHIHASARVAYDPALYSAIVEHQQAVKTARMGSGGASDFQSETEATVQASRLRLKQLGLSDETIDDVGQPAYDASSLLLGTPGRHVWVYVDLYDYEAAFVKPHQRVLLTSAALPNKTFEGKVCSVDSLLNSDTRTLRVRVELPNPQGLLRPEMYLDADIHATLGKQLAIPEGALVDTGARQLVYVQTAPDTYEPREIKVGPQAGDFYSVFAGLKSGEVVSTSANFLIDSESKINAATLETTHE